MTKLRELASLIRSKNAGPFVLTFDVMFLDSAGYERAKACRVITPTLVAGLYRVAESDVVLVYHDAALAIKFSIPRPQVQCALDDSDCYGGQQYVPLMNLTVS